MIPIDLSFRNNPLNYVIKNFHQQIGLAVGDIDKIQQKSVMERYVMQVEYSIR